METGTKKQPSSVKPVKGPSSDCAATSSPYDLAPTLNDQNDDAIATQEELKRHGMVDEDSWILEALHQMTPEAEITVGSVKALSQMLDAITVRVIEEARSISDQEENDHSGRSSKLTLTSLDLHKALKRLLPGDPGEQFRPYLPAVTKKAWSMDKQSLKGIKRQKTGK